MTRIPVKRHWLHLSSASCFVVSEPCPWNDVHSFLVPLTPSLICILLRCQRAVPMKWRAFLPSATDRLASLFCFIVSKPCLWNDPHSCPAHCFVPQTRSLIHVCVIVSEQCPWKEPHSYLAHCKSPQTPSPIHALLDHHVVSILWGWGGREGLRGGGGGRSSASATSGCCIRLQRRWFAGRQSLSSGPWHCRVRFLYPASVLLLWPCFLFATGLALLSPWYNRTGWLGVKHQLTYLITSWLTYSFFSTSALQLAMNWLTGHKTSTYLLTYSCFSTFALQLAMNWLTGHKTPTYLLTYSLFSISAQRLAVNCLVISGMRRTV